MVEGECIYGSYTLNADGYPSRWDPRLKKKVEVHREVCRAAHGEPPPGRPQTAHGCGNRPCINPNHLRWASNAENCADKVAHGRSLKGRRNPSVVLTEDDVRAIRRSPLSCRALAAKYGVVYATISAIRTGRSWAWLE